MMTQPQFPIYASEPGRGAAFVVYVLYLMSIPSAGILAFIGLVVAYTARADAVGVARMHIEEQIRIWWLAFWSVAAIIVAHAIGIALTVVLIGIPILLLASLAGLIVMVWFTVKSAMGLIALLDGRAR
jgi:uncharacterized membrane protein